MPRENNRIRCIPHCEVVFSILRVQFSLVGTRILSRVLLSTCSRWLRPTTQCRHSGADL